MEKQRSVSTPFHAEPKQLPEPAELTPATFPMRNTNMNRHRTTAFVALLSSVATLFALSPTLARAENFYGFEKIFHGPTDAVNYTGQPVQFEANLKGGVIVVKMPDTSGSCESTYRFKWEFKQDISKLAVGKEFDLVAVGEVVEGNCKNNTNEMYLASSMSGSELADKTGIKNRGKVIRISGWPGGSVTAYPSKRENNLINNRADAKLGISAYSLSDKLDQDYFTLAFHFASHPYTSNSKLYKYEVVYLYKKNHTATDTAGAINCPAVFRLGIQLGIISLATHNDEDVGFCVETLDYAIEAAKGSGCLPAEKLVDLQKRMKAAKSSKAFYNEVIALRAEYVTLVDANCGCGG
jgi:hypothetical protein